MNGAKMLEWRISFALWGVVDYKNSGLSKRERIRILSKRSLSIHCNALARSLSLLTPVNRRQMNSTVQTLQIHSLLCKWHNTPQYQHTPPLIPFLSPETTPNPVYCNPFEFYTYIQLLSSCVTRGMFKTVAVEYDWRRAFSHFSQGQ